MFIVSICRLQYFLKFPNHSLYVASIPVFSSFCFVHFIISLFLFFLSWISLSSRGQWRLVTYTMRHSTSIWSIIPRTVGIWTPSTSRWRGRGRSADNISPSYKKELDYCKRNLSEALAPLGWQSCKHLGMRAGMIGLAFTQCQNEMDYEWQLRSVAEAHHILENGPLRTGISGAVQFSHMYGEVHFITNCLNWAEEADVEYQTQFDIHQ